VDVIFTQVPELPKRETSVCADDVLLTSGGAAANVAFALAKLDVPVRFVYPKGEDAGDLLSQIVDHGLRAFSPKVLQPVPLTAGSTRVSVTFVAVHTDDLKSRSFVHRDGSNGAMTLQALTDLLGRGTFDGTEVCFFGALGNAMPYLDDPRKFAAFLEALRRRGTKVAVDVVPSETIRTPAWQAAMECVWPHVDMFMPNEVEASWITGRGNARESADWFLKRSVGMVFIKRGADGLLCALRRRNGRPVYIDTPSVTPAAIADSTGAGDAWNAGLIAALFKGEKDISRAVWIGNATASFSLEGVGATGSIPDYKTVLARARTFLQVPGSNRGANP
jgi:sugar/nucleoside kinase (ribokinase family)